MVDVGLVGWGCLLDEDVGVGHELGRAVSPPLGHLGEIADEVHELLAVGEQVGKSRGHERRLGLHPLIDGAFFHDGLAAAGRGVAEHDLRVGLAGDDAREAPAVVGDDRDTPVGGTDRRRRVEQRLDEVGHETLPRHALGHGGEVRAQRRLALAGDVALRAGEVAGVEEVRPLPGIARVGHLGDEGGAVLGGERGRQSGRLRRVARRCRAARAEHAPEHHAQPRPDHGTQARGSDGATHDHDHTVSPGGAPQAAPRPIHAASLTARAAQGEMIVAGNDAGSGPPARASLDGTTS